MQKRLWILCLLMCRCAFASDLDTDYQLELDLTDFTDRVYQVHMKATITNQGDQSIDELVWMFYPNRYQKPLPGIDDINLHRIYPHGYSRGSLTLDTLSVDDQVQDVTDLSFLEPDRYGELFKVQKLSTPLVSGASVTVTMDLTLKVPEKFGSFGWYREQLTMSGGWSPVLLGLQDGTFHPEYQMPTADWNVEVMLSSPYELALPLTTHTTPGTINISNARQVSIKAGKLSEFTLTQGDYQCKVYHEESRSKVIQEPMQDLFENFVSFLSQSDLEQSQDYTLAQSPLREMLVVDGTPISYFSDRAFKVIGALDYFHEIPIYKSLFMQLYEPKLSKIEHEQDLFWVQEVVAWRLTEDLVEGLKIQNRDARDIGILQTLKFLPLVDRVLYTPQFAFYDVFYNLVYPQDYVRDEIRRHPNRQPFGQTILAHMQDELGQDITNEIIESYIQKLPKEGFRAYASAYVGKDLSQRFEQWTSPRPKVNYRLGKHHKKKIDDMYHHWITIHQQAKRPLVEPVTLKVSYKDKSSEHKTWMSDEAEHTFHFLSEEKIKAIEIDPENRLLETLKSDNRRPAYWKFVVLSMFVEYDFEENQPLFLIQGQFRKRYGGLDRFDIGGYSQFQAYGVSLGYTRLFGKIIDTLRLSHGFRFGLNFNVLDNDLAIVETDSGPAEIEVTSDGYATDASLSYVFGNQLSYINPLKGSYGSLTLRLSNPLFGTQFDYRLLTFNVAGIVPINPNHLWGIRFRVGSSGGDEMPSQLQYRLGGISSMRGLPLTDDSFTGKHIILLTNEYRHLLIQDMDVNLWLFRIRRIQGALYSNAGHTTHTVQEQADVDAGLKTDTTDFSDLLDVQNWKVDVGYGLRVFVHYFGVSPSLLSFDVARSVTESGYGWLYYIGVNQTF